MINSTLSINSQKNMTARDDRTFLVCNNTGLCQSLEHGFYLGDTRLIKQYEWNFGSGILNLQSHSRQPDLLFFHYARMSGVNQLVAFRRWIRVAPETMQDKLGVPVIDAVIAPFKLAELMADTADKFGWYPSRKWGSQPPSQTEIDEWGLFGEKQSTYNFLTD